MIEVYLEAGSKKVFAVAVEWPGWARSARDADGALDALVAYGPRYKRALGAAARGLALPKSRKDLKVVGRVKGNATTDFGAPDITPKADRMPLDQKELKRTQRLVRASWDAFDASADAHARATLTTGPRGGGRDVPKMRVHVMEGDMGYLSVLGGTVPRGVQLKDAEVVRAAFLDALEARARGDLPDTGPRGGKRWLPRFAARRSAWHALDHAWEIEDRAT
jgi:hypothetical protein